MKRREFVHLGLAGLGAVTLAQKGWPRGDAEIVITGEAPVKIPIAVVRPSLPAGADATLVKKAQELREGLIGDAEFSGRFEILTSEAKLEEIAAKDRETGEISFSDWWDTRAQAVIKTELEPSAEGYVFQYRIYDVGKREYKGGKKIEPRSDAMLRRALHLASDDLLKRICDVDGIAETRIAYIRRDGKAKELFVMDYDGHPDSVRQITRDGGLCLFPSWHPSGKGIAFTSYRQRNPDLHYVDLEQGKRSPLSLFAGVNYGASFHPKDGNTMVLTLSKDGNPEIYEVNTITKKSRRLTNDPNVDCSPVYSPDGSRIAFTSGRSSRPHIYVMSADGTNQKALTQGRYEDSAAWHPAGDWIAFAQKQPTTEDFDVCVIRPNGTGYKVLTQGNRHNESPEFSPDGRHIVFASNRDGQSQIYSMNLETGKTHRLTWQTGECFSPAWSPV